MRIPTNIESLQRACERKRKCTARPRRMLGANQRRRLIVSARASDRSEKRDAARARADINVTIFLRLNEPRRRESSLCAYYILSPESSLYWRGCREATDRRGVDFLIRIYCAPSIWRVALFSVRRSLNFFVPLGFFFTMEAKCTCSCAKARRRLR